ncbi:ATP12-domain-containing protein [Balamuthia mandrillaris]
MRSSSRGGGLVAWCSSFVAAGGGTGALLRAPSLGGGCTLGTCRQYHSPQRLSWSAVRRSKPVSLHPSSSAMMMTRRGFRPSSLALLSSSSAGAPATTGGSSAAPKKRLWVKTEAVIPGKTKRWYKKVDVEQTEDGMWAVTLDGRQLLTPKGHVLAVPEELPAYAIAGEWEMQKEVIKPSSMPMMTLATTTIDRLINEGPQVRHALVLQLLDYLATDQICYRDDKNMSLRDCQSEILDPVVQWFSRAFNVDMTIHYSIKAQEQPPHTLNTIRMFLHSECNDWHLACLDHITSYTKSMILALGVLRGRYTSEDIFAFSRVDEHHQLAQWGEVEGDHDVEKQDLLKLLNTACFMLHCLHHPRSV